MNISDRSKQINKSWMSLAGFRYNISKDYTKGSLKVKYMKSVTRPTEKVT